MLTEGYAHQSPL